ncbi:MAG: dicarboxylate/amino acid:cation symporter [Cytophagales bacterium]|nr:dicarboxylate/amino acid:cation symporter [Armatimonadota bacterium]
MPQRRGLPLHTRIFIGLILGAVAGAVCQATLGAENAGLQAFVKNVAQPIGQVFLRLIFMIVVPLLFSALVLGVAELGDASKVGRVGVKSLLMTVLLSGSAVALALLMANVFQPGAGIDPVRRERLTLMLQSGSTQAAKSVENAQNAKPISEALLEIIPRNPLEEAVRALDGGLLPLMFFALIFGIAVAAVDAEKVAPLKRLLEAVLAASLKVIDFAMAFGPIGVFALIFSTTALLGTDALFALGKYVLVVLAALAIHQFVAYSLAIRFIARRSPVEFFKQIRGVMLTAFATSSSNATLPTALRAAEEDLKLPRDISTFVLTVGATANQNGTALFEGITVLFLAQFFGVTLDLGQQLLVLGLAILAGVGTAGVPGGSWPMIAIVLLRVGVPAEAIGIVLGIDRILDMSRTVLNVTGDLTIAACVSTLEGRKSVLPAQSDLDGTLRESDV